ncbi:MAG: hypothetical protein GY943_01100, partial [Chloroflexi bacterium]|nr:hypothetical protein [Chloroflexota bacterium]
MVKTDSTNKKEWVYVLLVTILFILLTLVPYGLGYLTALPDSLFTGLIMNPEDAQTYWAKMV